MQLNSEVLLNSSSSAVVITELQVSEKASKKESDDGISYENFSKSGGDKINLGYNITGYQDARAGQLFASWDEGKWEVATRTLTSTSEKGVELGKEVVEYLENNLLPIPKQCGTIHLDTEGNGNLAKWQDGQIVYVREQVKEPIDMLKIIASLK